MEFFKSMSDQEKPSLEVSIVMPCLNEADTVAICVKKAIASLQEHGIQGEVILADNGSTDQSQALATAAGARVVPVKERGYGAALMGGNAAAKGTYVLMGDADDSYDFSNIAPFVKKIREGYDLVMGCRLPSGGGTVAPGAMPFTHRYFGNPFFSLLARTWFKTPVHDVYCGMRIFRKDLFTALDLRCTGMEFATEMIIKASLFKKKIAEVPITLHPDGRVAHPPHLKTVRDGLKTLRFYLLFSPQWLFWAPGITLFLLGLIGFVLIIPGPLEIMGIYLDVQTMLIGGIAMLIGWQLIVFSLFTTFFANSEKLLPEVPLLAKLGRIVSIRTGFWAGALLTLAGITLILWTIVIWKSRGFGVLNLEETLRLTIPGAITLALGIQTVFSSFFFSILLLKRKI